MSAILLLGLVPATAEIEWEEWHDRGDGEWSRSGSDPAEPNTTYYQVAEGATAEEATITFRSKIVEPDPGNTTEYFLDDALAVTEYSVTRIFTEGERETIDTKNYTSEDVLQFHSTSIRQPGFYQRVDKRYREDGKTLDNIWDITSENGVRTGTIATHYRENGSLESIVKRSFNSY